MENAWLDVQLRSAH